MTSDRYNIVRFFRDGTPKKIIKPNVTLHEAQTHCNDPKTSGDGWFDGYVKIKEPK